MSQPRETLEIALAPAWQLDGQWSDAHGRQRTRALDRATGAWVQISAAHAETNGPAAARFFREIAAMERLAHQPAAVPLIASGRADGWQYAVEPLPGMSVRDYVRANGPLPAEHAMSHALSIADLLHFAHGIGLTHGAVSARALMLNGEHIQLGGFRATRQHRSTEEQARAASRDVFGLACALFEMVTGAAWSSRRAIPEWLPSSLVHCLDRALSPERDVRYTSAIGFAQALCAIRDELQTVGTEVSGRDAGGDAWIDDLPLSDAADRSLRVLHALLDRAEVADVPPDADDPLVVHCWHRAAAQVREGDARLVALRCRWRLLAERDPSGAVRASQQAPDAALVLPYRARALAAVGRAAEARTLAIRSWFSDAALDLSGVRSLVVALLLTRAFEMASLVSVSEFASGVVDPVMLAARETSGARGVTAPLTPAAQARTLRVISDAIDHGVPWTAELLVDPRWDPLRANPRFAGLLARAKATWTT